MKRGLLGYMGVPSYLRRYMEVFFEDLGIRSSSQHRVLRARQSPSNEEGLPCGEKWVRMDSLPSCPVGMHNSALRECMH